jgi:hypothetical protein
VDDRRVGHVRSPSAIVEALDQILVFLALFSKLGFAAQDFSMASERFTDAFSRASTVTPSAAGALEQAR